LGSSSNQATKKDNTNLKFSQ